MLYNVIPFVNVFANFPFMVWLPDVPTRVSSVPRSLVNDLRLVSPEFVSYVPMILPLPLSCTVTYMPFSFTSNVSLAV